MKTKDLGWKILVVITLASMALGITGCDPFHTEPGSLKIGVLPILDVLPLYVAEQEGYFTAEGIDVELVPFASAVERDVALQTDQIDGEVNDLVSVALLNNEDDRVRVVRTAMRATPEKAMFVVLSVDDAIQSATDLKGKEIGISGNSVIEYVVDRLLQAEGLRADEVVKQEIPKIPVRLELLTNGNIPAACLPEPLASLAEASGAHVVIDDRSHPEYAQSVVTLSARALGRKAAAVKRFLSAYEKAVAALNGDPDKYRPLLIEQGRVPEPVKDTFAMPVFPPAGVPTEAEVADVLDWMAAKEILARDLVYGELVTDDYLP